MPTEYSSESASTVVTLYNALSSGGAGAALADSRNIRRKGVSRAALHLAYVDPRPAEIPAATVSDRPDKAVWSTVFNFVIEGFAVGGASLHPAAHFNAGGHLPETEVPPREAFAANERPILSLIPSAEKSARDDQRDTNGFTVTLEKLSEGQDLAGSDSLSAHATTQPRGWSWLTSSWEVVAALWAHMRREREIRKAIDALAELDDFTLKDIGIHHRSQIEYAVRSGHDF